LIRTISTHEAVFTWMLQRLADAHLVKGKTVGIDATTLEANAALRSIVRRDTGESYQDFLTKLAQASGIETPTRADLARIDRKRKKKGSNNDWRHPQDPDAKITKMKDGRTHLAHKAEHAVDLETGAIVGVTVQDAEDGDTETSIETLIEAAEQIEAVQPEGDGLQEVVGDKGYHSNQSLVDLEAIGLRSYISEPVADDGSGRRSPSRATRSTVIVVAFGARAVCACCACAASAWNGPSRISTRRAGCVVSISAGTRTFGSAC
jgi:transposase